MAKDSCTWRLPVLGKENARLSFWLAGERVFQWNGLLEEAFVYFYNFSLVPSLR